MRGFLCIEFFYVFLLGRTFLQRRQKEPNKKKRGEAWKGGKKVNFMMQKNFFPQKFSIDADTHPHHLCFLFLLFFFRKRM